MNCLMDQGPIEVKSRYRSELVFRIILGFLFSFLILQDVRAQLESSHWYFGNKAGIKFLQSSVSADLNCTANSGRGASTVSDSNGTLLFYYLDDTLWNSNHEPMLNGTGLYSDNNSEQSTVTIPFPGTKSKYIVFTTDWTSIYSYPDSGLFYHIVDLTLDGGLGGVVEEMKNITIIDSTAEKIAATRHANGLDYWVMIQQSGSSKYHAFLVTESGVSSNPVTSVLGPYMGASTYEGQLRFSHRGHLLVNTFSDDIAIFDFDNSTGQLSNLRLIEDLGIAYGAEFSSDDTKLYTGGPLQFDVTLGSASAIAASMVPVWQSSNGIPTTMHGLQYGLDGRIYGNNHATGPNGYMAVINNPNEPGFACGYQDSAVYLEGRNGFETVPNFPSDFFTTDFVVNELCSGDTAFFQVNFHFIDSVLWNFGDPGSGVLDTSSAINPWHVYTQPGAYTVTLIAQNGAVTDTVVRTIYVKAPPEISLGPDTEICAGIDSIKLSIGGAKGSYLWNNSSTDSTIYASSSGNYWVNFTNSCGSDSDTINITSSSALQVNLGNDSAVCGESLIIIPSISNENSWTTYRWSNGDSTRITSAVSSGSDQNSVTLWLTATNACGFDSDSVSITFLAQPDGVLPADSIYCLDRPFYLLNPYSEGINYLWNDSSTGPDLRVDSSGSYWLLSFNECDTLLDEFKITFNGEPKVELGNDTFLCPGVEVKLFNRDANASPEQTIRWSSGSTDSTINVSDSGLYVATVTLRECQTRDSIFIYPKQYCPERCKPGIANVITPNGDGINDVLRIEMLCHTSDLKLHIYNRWGQLVHQGTSSLLSWDGSVNGEPASDGTYFYVLTFTDEAGEGRAYRGSFSLLRE